MTSSKLVSKGTCLYPGSISAKIILLMPTLHFGKCPFLPGQNIWRNLYVYKALLAILEYFTKVRKIFFSFCLKNWIRIPNFVIFLPRDGGGRVRNDSNRVDLSVYFSNRVEPRNSDLHFSEKRRKRAQFSNDQRFG